MEGRAVMTRSDLRMPARLHHLREAFFETGNAARVLAGRTSFIDGIVLNLYNDVLAPVFPSGLVLLAAGGYGRCELFPCSDIDLLILSEQDLEQPRARDSLSAFLRQLWDLGLRLSHSIRTTGECLEVQSHNVELNTSLLDQRRLAGDLDLHARLERRLPGFLRAQRNTLARHLVRLASERHTRYGQTTYHLEPDIKEGPGGLRDLHLLTWLRRLRDAGDPYPSRRSTAEELGEQIGDAREFIHAARCFLHYEAGRDNNRLTFASQDAIAEQSFTRQRDPALWMRDYYRYAGSVFKAAVRAMEAAGGTEGSLLTQFRDWRSRLSNADFTVSRERVYLRSPHQLHPDPDLVLRLFQFVARHGLRLALDTERRLERALPSLAGYYSRSRPLWPTIEELLNLPHAHMALRMMNDTGVLRALFPEWEAIEHLVVRDFYHRYTVDEHSLMAIQTLAELKAGGEAPRCGFANLMLEMDATAPLYFALLFHDTGKGRGLGTHLAESVRAADDAMERIQVPAGVRKLVRVLIRHHLDLSAAMSSRDLDDPDVIADLAARIETIEQLKHLALLTYADISAVNPGAMTPWRREQLWKAYLCTYRELTTELEDNRISAFSSTAPEETAFLEGFPTRYLRTHTPPEIREHLELRKEAVSTGVALRVSKNDSGYSLVIVTKDRPFLFASIAGALAGFGMNILKAEAFANRNGEVLDTFVFADPLRTLELNPVEVDRLRLTIERAVLDRLDVRRLLDRPNPPAPPRSAQIKPSVSFDGTASATATLVEIVAADRPGLLYALARCISDAGCDIDVVLVDTKAHRALDVFYITSERRKLTDDRQAQLRDRLLKACET